MGQPVTEPVSGVEALPTSLRSPVPQGRGGFLASLSEPTLDFSSRFPSWSLWALYNDADCVPHLPKSFPSLPLLIVSLESSLWAPGPQTLSHCPPRPARGRVCWDSRPSCAKSPLAGPPVLLTPLLHSASQEEPHHQLLRRSCHLTTPAHQGDDAEPQERRNVVRSRIYLNIKLRQRNISNDGYRT